MAIAARVVAISARAGVQRHQQHEPAGKGGARKRAGNGDGAVLKRLTQNFERAAVELGELIEKQHPVMRKRDLAGRGRRAATDQAGFADRVMGCSVGTRRQQRLAGAEQSHRAVDAGGFDRFASAEPGQNGGHAFGEHCLAGARRAEHQEIVISTGGDGDGALGHLLPADISKVDVVGRVLVEPLVEPRRGWIDLDGASKEGHGLRQAGDGDHVDTLDDGCLGRAGRGDNQSLQARLSGRGHGHRQRAAGRAGATVESQLAHHGKAVEKVGGNLSAAGQDAQRNRQVERSGLLG